jgi:hypothetical protein
LANMKKPTKVMMKLPVSIPPPIVFSKNTFDN